MGRKCSACSHNQRSEIDKELVGGAISVNSLANKYGLAETSLRRHFQKHIPKTLTQASKAADTNRADNLLDQVEELQQKALSILAKAELADNLRVALAAIREARESLELLAKMHAAIAMGKGGTLLVWDLSVPGDEGYTPELNPGEVIDASFKEPPREESKPDLPPPPPEPARRLIDDIFLPYAPGEKPAPKPEVCEVDLDPIARQRRKFWNNL